MYVCIFSSRCFCDFPFVTDFQQLNYDVPWCEFLYVYLIWCLMTFVDVWICSFLLISTFIIIISSSIFPFLEHNYMYYIVQLLDTSPQLTADLFIHFRLFFSVCASCSIIFIALFSNYYSFFSSISNPLLIPSSGVYFVLHTVFFISRSFIYISHIYHFSTHCIHVFF